MCENTGRTNNGNNCPSLSDRNIKYTKMYTKTSASWKIKNTLRPAAAAAAAAAETTYSTDRTDRKEDDTADDEDVHRQSGILVVVFYYYSTMYSSYLY